MFEVRAATVLRMSQETALSELAASTQHAEIRKKEDTAVRGFVKKYIEPLSMALDRLNGATSFKAFLAQPIKDLEAAGDVGARECGDAASSAQSDVDFYTAIVDSIVVEKETHRAATEASAKARAAREAPHSQESSACVKRSRGGGGGSGSGASGASVDTGGGEFCFWC